jgi:AcrR family transcriptional regulator
MAKEAGGGEELNLLGQRIGVKGRLARERLLAAARRLMQTAPGALPTLKALTAEAGVPLTIIYRYYADVGALLIDAMKPLQAEMAPVTALLADPWPQDDVRARALSFAQAHFDYWRARRGALFLRNSLAERGDPRFVELRAQWAMPLFRALAAKLASAHGRAGVEKDLAIAGILISGMERTTTLSLQALSLTADGTGEVTRADAAVLVEAEARQQATAELITLLMRYDHLGA